MLKSAVISHNFQYDWKNLPAQMWRDDIRNIDIIDATQEGCSNDH